MSTELFPVYLSEPYAEGFEHRTAVSEMGGGREIAAALHASVGRFVASGGLFLPQPSLSKTFDDFETFFRARRGRYDTFLYLPAWERNGQSISEAVGTGDGVTDLFALDYKYPKTGTFTLTVAGVGKDEGTHWNLADSAGGSFSLGEDPYIEFTGGNVPSAAQAIVATYRHYVPVRFTDDDLLERLINLTQQATGALSTFRLDRLRLRQDYPGSHLSVVPTP